MFEIWQRKNVRRWYERLSANNLIDLQRETSIDLERIATWVLANKLTLNTLKSEYMLVGSRQRVSSFEGKFQLRINNISLFKVQETKCLGLQIDEYLTGRHISKVSQRKVCSLSQRSENLESLPILKISPKVYNKLSSCLGYS